MTEGPYAGRDPLARAIVIARAFMAVGPAVVDESIETERQRGLYTALYGPAKNVWVRHKRANGPDVFIRANEESGENVIQLPEGAQEIYTIDPRGANAVRTWFGALVAKYRAGELGPVDPDLAESFALTSEACEGDFQEAMTQKLADRLTDAGAFTKNADGTMAPLDGQRVATGVNEELDNVKATYRRYGATSWLVGSLQTARDVSMGVSALWGNQHDWQPFVCQLFSHSWNNVGDLASAVIKKAVAGGALSPILSLAEGRREQLDDMIEEARNAPDVDTMAELSYAACPVVDECELLYLTLKDAPDAFASQDQRRVWGQVSRLIREKRGRLKGGLIHAVHDLDGHEWSMYRKIIATAQAEGGEVAAEAVARRLVDKDMRYPRALLPALLASN